MKKVDLYYVLDVRIARKRGFWRSWRNGPLTPSTGTIRVRGNMITNELIVLKKSNRKPVQGDLFALSPQKGIYCFGKVIRTEVESKDSFVNGMNLIYIYNFLSNTIIPPEDICNQPLGYIGIVNEQLWKKGFAQNVSFSDVTSKELHEDIAFWDITHKEYVDIAGEKYNKVPKYSGIYGLGSYGIVGKEIQKLLLES